MRNEGDNFGVGMTITRIVDGRVEPIKDRHIEKRVECLVHGNIAELTRRHEAWRRQAEVERKKCDARRVKNSRWRMHYKKANECLQVAHSYKVVIDRMREMGV